MAEMQKLLAIKKEKKARAPEFIRQDSWLRQKIGNKPRWRRPKGKHSKMREKRIGKHPRVEIGYRNPVLVRSLTLTGMSSKIIHNLEELQKLNKQTDIAIVSATVGLKSKLEIAKKAQELGIKTNLRQDKLNERLAAMKKQHEEKKVVAKEAKNTAAEKRSADAKPQGGFREEAKAEPAKKETKPEAAQAKTEPKETAKAETKTETKNEERKTSNKLHVTRETKNEKRVTK